MFRGLILTVCLLFSTVGSADAASECPTERPDLTIGVKPETLIRACTELIQQNPRHARAYWMRGLGHHDKKPPDLDSAIADFTKAIELKQPFPAYFNRGWAYRDKKEYDRALADFNRVIAVTPSATTYTRRGRIYAEKGDIDRAIVDYNTAIQLEPKNPSPAYYRGLAYEQKGDKTRAVADYRRALAINPSYKEAKEAVNRLAGQP